MTTILVFRGYVPSLSSAFYPFLRVVQDSTSFVASTPSSLFFIFLKVLTGRLGLKQWRTHWPVHSPLIGGAWHPMALVACKIHCRDLSI